MDQKIVNLIEPISNSFLKKPISIQTLVSYDTTPEIFTYRFPTPINVEDCEMALVNLETWYSFANVTSSNNKFRYSVDGGNTWILIEMETGAYQLEEINDEIQRLMDSQIITILPNTSTLK